MTQPQLLIILCPKISQDFGLIASTTLSLYSNLSTPTSNLEFPLISLLVLLILPNTIANILPLYFFMLKIDFTQNCQLTTRPKMHNAIGLCLVPGGRPRAARRCIEFWKFPAIPAPRKTPNIPSFLSLHISTTSHVILFTVI